ncbi:MAG: hypothetical protein PVI57_12060 [Gemmatimonadota bacterium]|jgi:hypothetical protein
MDEKNRIPLWLLPLLLGLATLWLFRDFVFSDAMLYGSDTLSLGYVARKFYADAVTQQGVFPRWDPQLLGGIPFLEALASGDSLYPTSILLFVLEPYRALGWKLVIHVFAAGLFMFGWTRTLGRSRGAALVAGLAYSVAPFLVTLVRPGHDGKLFVTALTPLLFWVMEWTFVRRGLLPYVCVALVVTLVILTTHFQLAYFLFGAAGVYYAFRSVAEWRGWGDGGAPSGGRASLGRFGLFLAASAAGALAAGIQLVPAVDYVTEFSRRTATTTQASPEENLAYASSWSLHPEEVASLIVPEFAGNNAMGDAEWTRGTYWGRNPTRDNHPYAGLAVLLLAGVGFLGMPRRAVRWFLAGLGTLALLYALGRHTPVWRIFYEVLPGVRLFRAPDMVAFLFGFSAVTLSSFGVDRLLEGAGDGGGEDSGHGARAIGSPVFVLAVAAGVLLLGTLLAASGALFNVWTTVVYPDIQPYARQALETVEPFVVRGFFLATLLAAVLASVAFAAERGMLKGAGIVAALCALVLVDGGRVSAPFVQTLDFRQWARPDPIVQHLVEVQRSSEPFRVASADQRYQSVRPAMFGLELATGHHPNDLARYRELIGMRGSSEPRLLFRRNVQQLLNLRYLIVPGELEGLQPVLQTQVEGRIYESLYEFPTLPRARLVGSARVVPDERAMEVILSEDFDPATTAVLAREPGIELPGGPVEGTVDWVERGINRQRLRVTSESPALLVIADNWFPAWKATVSGREVELLRAYHTLRAVPVPAGELEVEIFYESGTLEASLALSLVTLLFLFGIASLDVLRRRRGRGER